MKIETICMKCGYPIQINIHDKTPPQSIPLIKNGMFRCEQCSKSEIMQVQACGRVMRTATPYNGITIDEAHHSDDYDDYTLGEYDPTEAEYQDDDDDDDEDPADRWKR